MAYTVEGLVTLLVVVGVMGLVPFAALALAALLLRRPPREGVKYSEGGKRERKREANSEADAPRSWPIWSKWIIVGSGVVGALASAGVWVWKLYERTGLLRSSQARADLPLTLPFFAGLGFFAGVVVGTILFGTTLQIVGAIGRRPTTR